VSAIGKGIKLLASEPFRLVSHLLCYLRGLAMFGKLVYVGPQTRIRGRKNIHFGKGVKILYSAKIDAYNGKIFFGDNVTLGDRDVTLIASQAIIKLFDQCYISGYTHIAAYDGGDIEIGADSMLGPNSLVISQNHGFRRRDILIRDQHMEAKSVVIGNDVWVGAYSAVLPGASISNGAVIGAHSVITRKTRVEEFKVYGGNPAKLLAERT